MKLYLRILEVVLKSLVTPFTLEVIAILWLVGWQGQLRIEPSFNKLNLKNIIQSMISYPASNMSGNTSLDWILSSNY